MTAFHAYLTGSAASDRGVSAPEASLGSAFSFSGLSSQPTIVGKDENELKVP